MSRFRVPNLHFVFIKRPHAPARTHIARSMVAGCTTECGIPLKVGMPWRSKESQEDILCKGCQDSINALRGGARISA